MTSVLAQPAERPVWFGSAARPVFGWLTTPVDGTASGGVLLAPPVGREARAARRALRRAALSLAARGLVALRFDYLGTGDAAGCRDDGELDRAWVDSIAAAAGLLRGCGVDSVSGVGMRLGATILGAAADAHDLDLDGMVLWDPCESGRSYLRELGALEALRREHVDVETDGSVETAEFVFSSQTAGELRRLRLPTLERRPLAKRILVLVRSDRTVSDKLRQRLDEEHVEWEATTDQAGLLDVDPLHASMPEDSLRRVVSWLAAHPGPRIALKDPEELRDAATFGDGQVRERTVRLGPNQLFGIVTEPMAATSGPLVVFLNVSNEEHTGPSRLWVELARRWASRGLTCLRFDLTGLGDSPWVTGAAEPQMYDQRWLTDMVDVATALRPEDPSDTVFVGLCSGAYLAVEAGLAVRARGVAIINPPVGIDFLYGTSRLADSSSATTRRLASFLKELALRARWLAVALWRVGRVVMPSVYSVDAMSKVVSNGTDLFVLASTDDLSPSTTSHRFDRFFSRRLVDPSNYEVHFVDGLDHSMFKAGGRTRAIAMLEAHVLDTYAGVAARPGNDKEPR
jgi:alpha/beta superfamily hydrolase